MASTMMTAEQWSPGTQAAQRSKRSDLPDGLWTLPPQLPTWEDMLQTMQLPPRVPLCSSTFSAYASMRGISVKETPQGEDPLHNAIYTGLDRYVHKAKLKISEFFWEDPRTLYFHLPKSLPSGLILYWDPLAQVNTTWSSLHTELSSDVSQNPSEKMRFDEFIRKSPPKYGKNHPKGDDVYLNFGWIKIGDKWVDPDGEDNVFDAFMNRSQESLGKTYPDFKLSQKSGPGEMSEEEQNEYYDWYVQYVTDEADADGDPRLMRITPETFAKWAEGATRGDQYDETAMEPSSPLEYFTDDPESKIQTPFGVNGDPQFDIETGSIMTDMVEVEDEPTLMREPNRLNIIQPPASFSYSYPGLLLRLERRAFLDEEDEDQTTSPENVSVASTPETFYSKRGVDHFASSDTPRNGKEKYERYVEEFSTLMKDVQDEATLNQIEFEKYDRVTTKNLEMQRENYMMKHYQDQNGSLVTVTSSASSSTPSLNDDSLETPATPTLKSTHNKSRQYERWFEGEIRESRILKAKNEIIGKTVVDAQKIATAESDRLGAERKRILAKYGVKDIHDIQGLTIPKPSGIDRDVALQQRLRHVSAEARTAQEVIEAGQVARQVSKYEQASHEPHLGDPAHLEHQLDLGRQAQTAARQANEFKYAQFMQAAQYEQQNIEQAFEHFQSPQTSTQTPQQSYRDIYPGQYQALPEDPFGQDQYAQFLSPWPYDHGGAAQQAARFHQHWAFQSPNGDNGTPSPYHVPQAQQILSSHSAQTFPTVQNPHAQMGTPQPYRCTTQIQPDSNVYQAQLFQSPYGCFGVPRSYQTPHTQQHSDFHQNQHFPATQSPYTQVETPRPRYDHAPQAQQAFGFQVSQSPNVQMGNQQQPDHFTLQRQASQFMQDPYSQHQGQLLCYNPDARLEDGRFVPQEAPFGRVSPQHYVQVEKNDHAQDQEFSAQIEQVEQYFTPQKHQMPHYNGSSMKTARAIDQMSVQQNMPPQYRQEMPQHERLTINDPAFDQSPEQAPVHKALRNTANLKPEAPPTPRHLEDLTRRSDSVFNEPKQIYSDRVRREQQLQDDERLHSLRRSLHF